MALPVTEIEVDDEMDKKHRRQCFINGDILEYGDEEGDNKQTINLKDFDMVEMQEITVDKHKHEHLIYLKRGDNVAILEAENRSQMEEWYDKLTTTCKRWGWQPNETQSNVKGKTLKRSITNPERMVAARSKIAVRSAHGALEGGWEKKRDRNKTKPPGSIDDSCIVELQNDLENASSLPESGPSSRTQENSEVSSSQQIDGSESLPIDSGLPDNGSSGSSQEKDTVSSSQQSEKNANITMASSPPESSPSTSLQKDDAVLNSRQNDGITNTLIASSPQNNGASSSQESEPVLNPQANGAALSRQENCQLENTPMASNLTEGGSSASSQEKDTVSSSQQNDENENISMDSPECGSSSRSKENGAVASLRQNDESENTTPVASSPPESGPSASLQKDDAVLNLQQNDGITNIPIDMPVVAVIVNQDLEAQKQEDNGLHDLLLAQLTEGNPSVSVTQNDTPIGLQERMTIHHQQNRALLTQNQMWCRVFKVFADNGGQLCRVRRGSIVFVVRVGSIADLERFWQAYQSGQLEKDIAKCLITKDLEEQAGCKLDLQLNISESFYRNGLQALEGKDTPTLASKAVTEKINVQLNGISEYSSPLQNPAPNDSVDSNDQGSTKDHGCEEIPDIHLMSGQQASSLVQTPMATTSDCSPHANVVNSNSSVQFRSEPNPEQVDKTKRKDEEEIPANDLQVLEGNTLALQSLKECNILMPASTTQPSLNAREADSPMVLFTHKRLMKNKLSKKINCKIKEGTLECEDKNIGLKFDIKLTDLDEVELNEQLTVSTYTYENIISLKSGPDIKYLKADTRGQLKEWYNRIIIPLQKQGWIETEAENITGGEQRRAIKPKLLDVTTDPREDKSSNNIPASSASASTEKDTEDKCDVSKNIHTSGDDNLVIYLDRGSVLNFNSNNTVDLPAIINIVRMVSREEVTEAMKSMFKEWKSSQTQPSTLSGSCKVFEENGAMAHSVKEGSIVFIVCFDSPDNLERFWIAYQSGKLAEELAKCLITYDLEKQIGSELDVQIYIDESCYRNRLQILELQLQKPESMTSSNASERAASLKGCINELNSENDSTNVVLIPTHTMPSLPKRAVSDTTIEPSTLVNLVDNVLSKGHHTNFKIKGGMIEYDDLDGERTKIRLKDVDEVTMTAKLKINQYENEHIICLKHTKGIDFLRANSKLQMNNWYNIITRERSTFKKIETEADDANKGKENDELPHNTKYHYTADMDFEGSFHMASCAITKEKKKHQCLIKGDSIEYDNETIRLKDLDEIEITAKWTSINKHKHESIICFKRGREIKFMMMDNRSQMEEWYNTFNRMLKTLHEEADRFPDLSRRNTIAEGMKPPPSPRLNTERKSLRHKIKSAYGGLEGSFDVDLDSPTKKMPKSLTDTGTEEMQIVKPKDVEVTTPSERISPHSSTLATVQEEDLQSIKAISSIVKADDSPEEDEEPRTTSHSVIPKATKDAE